jgi:hypothetical protein
MMNTIEKIISKSKTQKEAADKISKVEMIKLGPAAPPPPHWYPKPGDAAFDLMC